MIKTNLGREDHCGLILSYFKKDSDAKTCRGTGFLYAVSNDRRKGIVLTCAHNLMPRDIDFINDQQVCNFIEAGSV
jgi:hypothetical protein